MFLCARLNLFRDKMSRANKLPENMWQPEPKIYTEGKRMKKAMIGIIITIILFVVQFASAQEPQRIQFERGKSSAIVKGTTGEYGVTYVVKARSGQKIVLTLTPVSGVGIKVETEGADGQSVLLREEKGGTYEVGLDADGDYTIFLGSTNGRSKAFTLTVKITKMTDV